MFVDVFALNDIIPYTPDVSASPGAAVTFRRELHVPRGSSLVPHDADHRHPEDAKQHDVLVVCCGGGAGADAGAGECGPAAELLQGPEFPGHQLELTFGVEEA